MISAVVLTKNEEKNISRCLRSLDFVNEIIVIDDNSTDKTIDEILNLNLKIKIFQKKLNDDFSSQRNFGMEKAKGEWILLLDADEEVSDELKKEIKNILHFEDSKIGAYYIKRRDFWWGRELRFGEIKKVRNKGLIRLVRKNSGYWQGKVHEEFVVNRSRFKTLSLDSFINHYPHPSLAEFLNEINFYSSLRAKELYSSGKRTNIFEIIFYPLVKFILNYFFYFGFLDGAAGFAYAFLMSFHSFLVRAKMYQYQLKSAKMCNV